MQFFQDKCTLGHIALVTVVSMSLFAPVVHADGAGTGLSTGGGSSRYAKMDCSKLKKQFSTEKRKLNEMTGDVEFAKELIKVEQRKFHKIKDQKSDLVDAIAAEKDKETKTALRKKLKAKDKELKNAKKEVKKRMGHLQDNEEYEKIFEKNVRQIHAEYNGRCV